MSPQQSQVASLIKRLLLLIICGIASILLIKAIYALGPTQSADERRLKTRNFDGMPVELVEVRNLQSNTWYEDLEIELKNVSNKPIYFLTAYLEFPDEKLSWGKSGIRLSWGDPDKLDTRKYAESQVENVAPGKTFVLTIPAMYRKGLRTMHRMRPEVTKNFLLWFEKTYFGDGTGFESEGRWTDFRGNDPPPKPERKHHSGRSARTSPSSTSTSEPICGGGNCFRWVVSNTPGPSSCYGC